MNHQRGIATGWLYLIALIVLIGALTGLIAAWKSYTNGIDQKGYLRGKQETESAYAKRDNEALRLKAARIEELEKSARVLEAKHAKELAKIETQLLKEKSDAEAQRVRDVAAIRDGVIRLRDPGAVACGAGISGGSQGGEAATAAAGSDDRAETGFLSKDASIFLVTIAAEADDIARQLAWAQAVIREDRAICGE